MSRGRVHAAFLAIGLLLPFRAIPIGAAALQQGTSATPGGTPPTNCTPAGTQADEKPAPAGSAVHCITVNFDYDFTKTPGCSAKVKTACIQTFDVYDISGDKPYLLFSVPAPANAQGMMKGITATSPRMLFAVGKHRIGVSARMPNGEKSPPRDCKVVIEIKANNPPSPPASQ